MFSRKARRKSKLMQHSIVLTRPSFDLPHKPDDGGDNRALATDEAVIGLVAAGVATATATINPDEAGAACSPCHEGWHYVVMSDMAIIAAVMDDEPSRQAVTIVGRLATLA